MSQGYGTLMGQRGCCIPVMLSSGSRCHDDRYDFAFIVVICLFDSVLAYLANCCSAEVDWSCLDGVHRWLPTGLPTDVFTT